MLGDEKNVSNIYIYKENLKMLSSNQGSINIFSKTGKLENILVFVGRLSSVATTQLCCNSRKGTIQNIHV